MLRRTRGCSPQKTELTRSEILQAALDEFTEVGIAKATMDKIAKRANLTKDTLFCTLQTKRLCCKAHERGRLHIPHWRPCKRSAAQ